MNQTCWRSRDKLIRDVLLWTPTHGRAKAGRPARTYIQQLCEDTGCCPEDLPRAMNDREEWRERVRDIRATSAIWWWWWLIKIHQTKELSQTFHISGDWKLSFSFSLSKGKRNPSYTYTVAQKFNFGLAKCTLNWIYYYPIFFKSYKNYLKVVRVFFHRTTRYQYGIYVGIYKIQTM